MTLQGVLLTVAAALMLFGAAGYALDVLPDLHGDLVEIGVRPTVLGGTVLHLHFAAMAMFGFALMVTGAAIQSTRGIEPARLPLAIIAVIYTVFGIMAFSRSHSVHHLGTLAMGVLIGAAIVIPRSRGIRSSRERP
jgi:NO-binding membrane sensor protein with MHYT domain